MIWLKWNFYLWLTAKELCLGLLSPLQPKSSNFSKHVDSWTWALKKCASKQKKKMVFQELNNKKKYPNGNSYAATLSRKNRSVAFHSTLGVPTRVGSLHPAADHPGASFGTVQRGDRNSLENGYVTYIKLLSWMMDEQMMNKCPFIHLFGKWFQNTLWNI